MKVTIPIFHTRAANAKELCYSVIGGKYSCGRIGAWNGYDMDNVSDEGS
jgi:hypothetical protein